LNSHEYAHLKKIELDAESIFQQDLSRLLTKEIFQTLDEIANADLVRAFEDLEKSCRLIEAHSQWTRFDNADSAGARYAGVSKF
jgi:hypothetical protein